MSKVLTLDEFIKNNSISEGFSATRVLDDGREQCGLLFKDNNERDIFAIYGTSLQKDFGPIEEIWNTNKDKLRFVHSRTQSDENGCDDKWRITLYNATKKSLHVMEKNNDTPDVTEILDEEEKPNPTVVEQEKEDQSAPTQEDKDINKDYIGALRERNGLLEYFEFPISQYYDILLDELGTMKDDDSKALPALESRFTKDFPDTEFSNTLFSYVFPHDYRASGINIQKYYHMRPQITIEYPHLLSDHYSEIMEEHEVNDMVNYIQSHFNQIETGDDQQLIFDKIKKDKDENKLTDEEYKAAIYNFFGYFGDQINVTEADKKQFLSEQSLKHDKDMKMSFLIDVERFVRAYQYQIEERSIVKLSDVKMYSTDQCGWKKFDYPIDDNITISIDTNFGFGYASYFMCILKYKGIDILPYSAIVKYYYAEMQDMKNCTRKYMPERDSWSNIFEFVINTVNAAKKNLTDFEEVFILSEIRKMMFGLRMLNDNPSSVINDIREKVPSRRDGYIFVRQFSDEDKELYEVLPREKLITDKIYKISSALEFLENLKCLSSILPVVNQYIDEIITMNNSMKPEIQGLITNVSNDIDVWKKKQEITMHEIEKNISLLSPHIEKIKKKYEETYKMPVKIDDVKLLGLFARDTVYQYEWNGHLALPSIEREYGKDVSAYLILIDRLKSLLQENKKIEKHINLRTKLIDVLQNSLQRIEAIIKAA